MAAYHGQMRLSIAPLGGFVYAQRRSIVQRLLSPDMTAEILASHGIFPESLEALRLGNMQMFIERRTSDLARLEIEFMMSKGVAAPVQSFGTVYLDDADDTVMQ
jgi:hypothetical protein